MRRGATQTRSRCGRAASALDYSQLAERARLLARGLRLKGLRRGDRVVLYMNNSCDYVAAMFARLAGGFSIVPVNVKLHHRELARIVAHCDARAILFGSRQRSSIAEAPARARPRGDRAGHLASAPTRGGRGDPARLERDRLGRRVPTTWLGCSTPQAPPATPKAHS